MSMCCLSKDLSALAIVAYFRRFVRSSPKYCITLKDDQNTRRSYQNTPIRKYNSTKFLGERLTEPLSRPLPDFFRRFAPATIALCTICVCVSPLMNPACTVFIKYTILIWGTFCCCNETISWQGRFFRYSHAIEHQNMLSTSQQIFLVAPLTAIAQPRNTMPPS